MIGCNLKISITFDSSRISRHSTSLMNKISLHYPSSSSRSPFKRTSAIKSVSTSPDTKEYATPTSLDSISPFTGPYISSNVRSSISPTTRILTSASTKVSPSVFDPNTPQSGLSTSSHSSTSISPASKMSKLRLSHTSLSHPGRLSTSLVDEASASTSNSWYSSHTKRLIYSSDDKIHASQDAFKSPLPVKLRYRSSSSPRNSISPPPASFDSTLHTARFSTSSVAEDISSAAFHSTSPSYKTSTLLTSRLSISPIATVGNSISSTVSRQIFNSPTFKRSLSFPDENASSDKQRKST
ncbi:hypothetical protein HNY73_018725 [Argiope bruennichi]|uniref:Uncharacterized protein n=1 Tax=Argiope bruennichi TaxID=94029 RepID=A0A8T0EE57_ARGBR|nr:hypothetical protein HNY73_018725 [Argiope bruennichi]